MRIESTAGHDRLRRDMLKRSLYIFQSGELRRKGNSLYFESDQRKKYLPVENINDIYLFGEVDVTKKFLEFASQKHIIVHYFNYYGYYSGSFYPREHLNSGHVLLKQTEHYLDEQKRKELANAFIQGSIQQMLRVLKYYRNRIKEKENELTILIDHLSENLISLNEKKEQDIHQMMAIEGQSREAYYQAFDWIIRNNDFIFGKRTRRPPENRMNALISFGNSILYVMVLSEIYKTYLDPRIGYLHSTNFRRFTLNLDVAEIFKPVIVDRLIFSLINKKVLSRKHFEKEDLGIFLTEEGKKKFVQSLDEKVKDTVNHRHLGKSVSHKRLIRLELYKLQKHFLGEKTYIPYQARW